MVLLLRVCLWGVCCWWFAFLVWCVLAVLCVLGFSFAAVGCVAVMCVAFGVLMFVLGRGLRRMVYALFGHFV